MQLLNMESWVEMYLVGKGTCAAAGAGRKSPGTGQRAALLLSPRGTERWALGAWGSLPESCCLQQLVRDPAWALLLSAQVSSAEQQELLLQVPCWSVPQSIPLCPTTSYNKVLILSSQVWPYQLCLRHSKLLITFLPQILMLSPQVSYKFSFDSVIFILRGFSGWKKGKQAILLSATLH